MEEKKQTIIISAFPGCGKTYASNNYKDDFVMLDSDSSNFSWLKDADGKNTEFRDPDFPNNYIRHIKENIGKADIIFVSSHANVRKALCDAGLKVILVYPDKKLKDEWIRRFKQRGNNEKFIKFISDNWDNFIDEIAHEEYGFLKFRISNKDTYISPYIYYNSFCDVMDNSI